MQNIICRTAHSLPLIRHCGAVRDRMLDLHAEDLGKFIEPIYAQRPAAKRGGRFCGKDCLGRQGAQHDPRAADDPVFHLHGNGKADFCDGHLGALTELGEGIDIVLCRHRKFKGNDGLILCKRGFADAGDEPIHRQAANAAGAVHDRRLDIQSKQNGINITRR